MRSRSIGANPAMEQLYTVQVDNAATSLNEALSYLGGPEHRKKDHASYDRQELFSSIASEMGIDNLVRGQDYSPDYDTQTGSWASDEDVPTAVYTSGKEMGEIE